jgi:hypothetical protein
MKGNLRQSYKLLPLKNKISIQDYLKITKLFMKYIFKKALEGDDVPLPKNCGIFSIVGSKIKPKLNEAGKPINLPPDWVRTKKYWDSNPQAKAEKKLLYITNEHTNLVRYRFFWSKKNMFVHNKYYYGFILARDNKRMIHHAVLNGKLYALKHRNGTFY